MNNVIKHLGLIALLGFSMTAGAGVVAKTEMAPQPPEPRTTPFQVDPEIVNQVQQKLQTTFQKVFPEFVGPSPVEGMFEVYANGKMYYYIPESNLLMFGELWSPEGYSVTARRVAELVRGKLKDLPLDQALVIGNGKIKVIEFVDPDCPFCVKYEQYLKTKSRELTRYVFFTPLDALHAKAADKAVHVLCSEHPERALEKIYGGAVAMKDLKTCEQGIARLKVHRAAAKRLGVTGTPTLVIAGQVITGFNKPKIEAILSQ